MSLASNVGDFADGPWLEAVVVLAVVAHGEQRLRNIAAIKQHTCAIVERLATDDDQPIIDACFEAIEMVSTSLDVRAHSHPHDLELIGHQFASSY
jgi:hypothetical protein